MNITPGCLVTYKPLTNGLPDNERHRVKVLSTDRDDMNCEDVFGNDFRLSYSRVENVEAEQSFNMLGKVFA